MNSQTSTVFVVDDELSVRKATSRLLQAAGLAVSAFASGQEFLDHYNPNSPGCLLLDLSMPGLSGLELQKALIARGDPPPIIFLTGHADVSETVQAMKGGAVEFLTKPVEDTILIDAVMSAIARDHIQRSARCRLAEIHKRLATLTPREFQVLGHVVAGKLNKQTAAELGTVEKTIKVHRARIIEKMQVRSLAELVLLAAQAGVSFPTQK
ncbi:MAG: response regulator transcription factor [Azoarcus sp.]|nr:response regulator transcription factor [Azoarcus sp.]